MPNHNDNNDYCCCPPESGDCCGPGSWCCARAGQHNHDPDQYQTTSAPLVHPIRTFRVAPRAGESLEALVNRVSAYLPSNFLVAESPEGDTALVAGFDNAGWDRDTYVLPRLASGLMFPYEPDEQDHLLEVLLNAFYTGYETIANDLDEAGDGGDPFDERLDCIDFVLAQLDLLRQVGLDQGFRHGQDFYLTRNHHGTGFWDRGYGHTGALLSEAAKVYGPTS